MIEQRLLDELCYWTRTDDTWRSLASRIDDKTCGVHLAVMVEPYITYMLQGKKTIESRFSKNRIAPYGRIKSGDVVLLKRAAGPVVASFKATTVEFISVTLKERERLRLSYSRAICADDTFWNDRREKKFATLVGVGQVQIHSPRYIRKSDRRGWLVLRESSKNTSL